MVSFSEDLDDFNWRLRVEAAPRVPRARRLRVEVGSGTTVINSLVTFPVISRPVLKIYFSPIVNVEDIKASSGFVTVYSKADKGLVEFKDNLSSNS